MDYNSQQWNRCISKFLIEPYQINTQGPKLHLLGPQWDSKLSTGNQNFTIALQQGSFMYYYTAICIAIVNF